MTKSKIRVWIIILAVAVLCAVCSATVAFALETLSDTRASVNTDSKNGVSLNKWEMQKEESSAEYAKHPMSSSDGLNVKLAQGDVLTFNQIIDLSKLTKSDALVDFFVTPKTIGGTDFERLYFTFADVENENCTLTLEAKASPDGFKSINYPWTYVYAAGNGQKLRSNTSWSGLSYDDGYGLGVVHSFWGFYGESSDINVANGLAGFGVNNAVNVNEYGLNDDNNLDAVHTSFSFDAQSNEVLVNGGISVFDLDDPSLSETVWSGFASGRVRLSVRADAYNASYASFVIKSVYGLDLSHSTFEDVTAPKIVVDLPTENDLETYIGNAFAIPQASVKDDYDKNCELSVSVWTNYSSLSPMVVEIVNDKFTATATGYYTIVYESTDASGNKAVTEVFVYAKPSQDLTVALREGYATNGTAGNPVAVAEYDVFGAVSDIYEISVTAQVGGETIEIKDGVFEPQKSGQYTVEYRVTDYFGRTAVKSYSLNVTNASAPVLKNVYDFPKALVSGIAYKIPSYSAHDYTSGSLVMRKMSLYVKDVKGERLAENETFIPTVNKNGDKITLTFRYGNLEIAKEIPVTLPVTDGKLHMENYFLSDGLAVAALSNGIRITANESNGKWLFANPLVVDNFSFALRANPALSNFAGIKVNLTDSENADVSVTLSLKYREGKTELQVGRLSVPLNYGFGQNSDANKNNIEITLNGSKLTVGDVNVRLTNTDGGEPFECFPSGKAYLSAEFCNASQGASYDVTSVNGQSVSSSANDRIRPKISLMGNYSICVLPKQTITVPRAVAGDVLSGIARFYVTVKDADGNIAKSTDGIVLDKVSADRSYELTAGSFGQYIVTYTAADTANGNDATRIFAITVEDTVPPEIRLGKIYEKVKLGDVIVVPILDYTDNCTVKENLKLFVSVYTPDGTVIALGDTSNSFKAAQKGEYQIRAAVYDESGNVGYKAYTVTVE